LELGLTEQEAATRFYTHLWPHRAEVLRSAQFLTGNAADAEDLAQETLMRAFRNVHQLDASGNPKGWLLTILRRIQIDRSRLRADTLLSDALPLEAIGEPTAGVPVTDRDPRDADALLEALSDKALIDGLKELPDDLRWTLLLVDVEQMSYDEAATVMEVPPGTVKSRIHRGRGLLKERLLAQLPPDSRTMHAPGNRGQWRDA
jgi:RNA polymerase sigma-70 factor (ECF subfamily)